MPKQNPRFRNGDSLSSYLVPSPATSATSVYLPSVLSSQRSRTNSFSLMRVLIVLERSYFFIASGARLTLHCLSDLRSDSVQIALA